MTEYKCDLCGKKISYSPVEIQDDIQVDEVVEVCKECIDEINETWRKIDQAHAIQKRNFIRRFISRLKSFHLG